jgi:hypothetical protein
MNPYQPNLSGAWFMQRAMSAQVGSSPPAGLTNYILGSNFQVMSQLGDETMRPFLQDVRP